jgi:N-carbamoyl-L-amino-acid hydrolase
VLAGLEVVRTLNDHGIRTEAPIEVAFWTNEEGSRFVPVMMGSGVFCGAFSLETAYAARDVDGKTVGEELARIGYLGDAGAGRASDRRLLRDPHRAGPGAGRCRQGDRRGAGRDGPVLVRLHGVTGMEAHAGPTPMGTCAATRCRWPPASCRKWWRSRTAIRPTAAARSAWCRCSRTAAT